MVKFNLAAAFVMVLLACTAIVADRAAAQTAYPGQMTQARVWVQNRGSDEAVPVDVRDVSLEKPLMVHVVNGEPLFGEGTTPVQIRAARQPWEYQRVEVSQRADVAAVLNASGAAGWEVVATLSATPEGTSFLMKRPR
jgi:hypothetical protein